MVFVCLKKKKKIVIENARLLKLFKKKLYKLCSPVVAV